MRFSHTDIIFSADTYIYIKSQKQRVVFTFIPSHFTSSWLFSIDFLKIY